VSSVTVAAAAIADVATRSAPLADSPVRSHRPRSPPPA
jgi:hypothetical protein